MNALYGPSHIWNTAEQKDKKVNWSKTKGDTQYTGMLKQQSIRSKIFLFD